MAESEKEKTNRLLREAAAREKLEKGREEQRHAELIESLESIKHDEPVRQLDVKTAKKIREALVLPTTEKDIMGQVEPVKKKRKKFTADDYLTKKDIKEDKAYEKWMRKQKKALKKTEVESARFKLSKEKMEALLEHEEEERQRREDAGFVPEPMGREERERYEIMQRSRERERKKDWREWLKALKHKTKQKKQILETYTAADKSQMISALITGGFHWLASNDAVSLIVTVLIIDIARNVKRCDAGWSALMNMLTGVVITKHLADATGEFADIVAMAGLGFTGLASIGTWLTHECAGGKRKYKAGRKVGGLEERIELIESIRGPLW